MFYSFWRMVSFLIYGYPVSAFERRFPPHTSKNLFKIPNQNITMSTVPKGSVYCFKFKIWFYLVHLQQLKGMQSSKQGMWKGHHFSIEGTFFVKNGMSKPVRGTGLDLGAEPPCIKVCWVPPGFIIHTANISQYSLQTVLFTRARENLKRI